MGQGVQNVGQWFHSQGGGRIGVKLIDHFGAQSVDSTSPEISIADGNTLCDCATTGDMDQAAATIGGAFYSWWQGRSSGFKADARTSLLKG